jgi:hypothetical protein
MTEYGALLTIAELGSGAADAYVKRIRESTELCQATSGLSGYAGCYKIDREWLERQSLALSGRKLVEDTATDGTPGSFGRNVSTYGTINIELSELSELSRPIPGTNLKGQYMVTATAFGEIKPGNATCTDEVAVAVSRQALRAHLVFGGVN